MLESIGIERRRDIAIMNVLKCRPPGNRNPAPAEVACCATYLRRQLLLVRPDVLLIMGRFAMQTLLGLGPDASIGSQRGRVHDVTIGDFGTKAVVSYHPSYLLRAPDEKAKAWGGSDALQASDPAKRASNSLPSITHTDNKDGVFPQWRKDAEEAVVILMGEGRR